MSISKEALRGYILEEILAYLIKGTGYDLLVDESQDPIELVNRHHGLVVKGRGAEHQADVLGQLKWIPAFTFPIRLFIEAKYRRTKTSIGPIRSAVGIIEDLNQNFSPMREGRILVKRYNYNYALFSVSGFSKDAVNMAIAHRVSLIDLSGPDFTPLLEMIDQIANVITQSINASDEVAASDDEEQFAGMYRNKDYQLNTKDVVYLIRKYLRSKLGTIPDITTDNRSNRPEGFIKGELEETLQYLVRFTIEEYRMLFIGMAAGPFMLVMKANNPESFLSYARRNPNHKINIHWSRTDSNGRRWIITPNEYGHESYELSFILPEKLSEIIFESNDPRSTARDIKRDIFSDITIYNFNNQVDELFRLRYKIDDI